MAEKIVFETFYVCVEKEKTRMGVVRQAKLGRTNRMKGVCTAKKTTCR